MKIIFKFLFILFLIIFIPIVYISIVGIETDKFNNQISNKIKDFDEKLEIKLKKVKLVLDPFKFRIKIKTVGSKFNSQNNIIEIESIKTQISLRSLIENRFSVQNLEISTKSIEIKKLISFLRTFENSPELFILEKTLNKGFIIADLKLEFDSEGNIKNNYTINGFIKDAKLSILKKYNFKNLDLIFKFQKNDLILSDINFILNNLNLSSKEISISKNKKDYFVKGNLNHKELQINDINIDLFIKRFLPKIDVKKLRLSSNNDFAFKIDNKFSFNNFELNSKILVNEFSINNDFNLKNYFSNIKDNFVFSDHEISIKYLQDDLFIDGKGKILTQENNDIISYNINKSKKVLNFKTTYKINDNPLNVDFLNYKKNIKNEAIIKLEGTRNKQGEILIKSFLFNEKKNEINIKNLNLNKRFKIVELDSLSLDYVDKDNQNNKIKFYSKKNQYYLDGQSFNANKLIEDLLSEKKNTELFNSNTKIKINIDLIRLDKEYDLFNLKGDIFLDNKEIIKAYLEGNFSNDEKLKFSVTNVDNNKITTLYVDKAEPIVKRYKFIKGFEQGVLDFYSSKKSGGSVSQLKIYDFKLKELPVLTKILTLASLQGIADILSGEGIGFDEFEMNFKNKGNLMTIDEIYAIGPAISILMDGYVEKNKIISLRGTLVPATTINKFIGSLPVLGKILVGSKTGEGVFGVSFKIKGPPKKLETSVNPVKTLTPRFITRTLEKIKKSN